MKILIPQHALATALNTIQRVVQNKPQLPVLSMVKIQTQKGIVHFFATDLISGVHTMVLAEVQEEGECIVPAKNLFSLISSLPQTNIQLEFSSGKLQIIAETLKTTFHTGNTAEFPDFPTTSGQKILFSKKELGQIAKLISISVSKDQVRPILASICFFSTDNQCEVVGTDGFRLSLLNFSKSLLPVEKMLISAKSLLEIEKIAQAGEIDSVELQVSTEQQTLVCTVGQTVFFSRLVVGEYPPYAKIIPREFTTSVHFHKQNLEENVKRSLIFSQNDTAFVQLELSSLGVELTSKNSLGEVLSAKLTTQNFQGQNTSISFNSRYLLDYLRTVEDEYVEFSMTEPLRPAQFTSKSTPNFIYVVMPFRAR